MSTPRITLAERIKAREKDHASIPAHIANLLAESQKPIFAWAADVDIALQSLGASCDELRSRFQSLAESQVPQSFAKDWNDPAMDAYNAARFVDNGDGTISDNKTGLMWADTFIQMPHADALAHCAGMTLLGYTDWRLPTIKELTSIIDYERHTPACDPIFNTLSDSYWSSSVYVYHQRWCAWYVNFSDGNVDATDKTSNYYVRAVRSLVKP